MPPRATGYIDVQIIGQDRGVSALLQRMETGFSTLGMAAFLGTTVGPWLQQRAKQRFKNEGDDVSGKWAPLKGATEQIRRQGPWAVGAAHPINVRTHEMENYVTGSKGDAIPVGSIAQLTFPDPNRGSGKELREKMKTAQQGKKKPSTVSRPVIGLGTQDLTFTVAALALYAKKIGTGKRV